MEKICQTTILLPCCSIIYDNYFYFVPPTSVLHQNFRFSTCFSWSCCYLLSNLLPSLMCLGHVFFCCFPPRFFSSFSLEVVCFCCFPRHIFPSTSYASFCASISLELVWLCFFNLAQLALTSRFLHLIISTHRHLWIAAGSTGNVPTPSTSAGCQSKWELFSLGKVGICLLAVQWRPMHSACCGILLLLAHHCSGVWNGLIHSLSTLCSTSKLVRCVASARPFHFDWLLSLAYMLNPPLIICTTLWAKIYIWQT